MEQITLENLASDLYEIAYDRLLSNDSAINKLYINYPNLKEYPEAINLILKYKHTKKNLEETTKLLMKFFQNEYKLIEITEETYWKLNSLYFDSKIKYIGIKREDILRFTTRIKESTWDSIFEEVRKQAEIEHKDTMQNINFDKNRIIYIVDMEFYSIKGIFFIQWENQKE